MVKPATEILQGAIDALASFSLEEETIVAARADYMMLRVKIGVIQKHAAALVELRELLARSSEPVAWCDDKCANGSIGNVCSDAAKRYWEKNGWADKLLADKHTIPLFAQPTTSAQPLTKTQIQLIADTCAGAFDYEFKFARAIEAAHGITTSPEKAHD